MLNTENQKMLGSEPPTGERGWGSSLFVGSHHPTAALFHFLFRTCAIVVYLFGSWFTNNYVFIFVIDVLLSAFDFWTVKNVTGRLMVGLRWWNEVKEDGTNVWVFESNQDVKEISSVDARLFWLGLYVYPAIWVVFAISNFASIFVLEFRWLLIVGVSLVLLSANVIGYWKCQKDKKKKIQMFIAQNL